MARQSEERVPVIQVTGLKKKYKLGQIGVQNMVDFYKVKGIGNTGNLEWHIFQIQSDAPMETGTIEWLAMENGQYTVAIPYFPLMTTDMYEGYKFGGQKATVTAIKPETNYGSYKKNSTKYVVLPEGWEKGYYWTVDALSNYALSDLCSAEDNALIHSEWRRCSRSATKRPWR